MSRRDFTTTNFEIDTVQWNLNSKNPLYIPVGPPGYTGVTGPPGFNESTGSTGAQGVFGNIGLPSNQVGLQGLQGLVGPIGPTGYTSIYNGEIGLPSSFSGRQGIQGLPSLYAGEQGVVGLPSSFSGRQGVQGLPSSYTGEQGVVGLPSSFSGRQGVQGLPSSYTGEQGVVGLPSSFSGRQGVQGLPSSYTGSQGVVGLPSSFSGRQGVQGVQSVFTGSQGVVGIASSFTGHTGANGKNEVIPGPQGMTGPQGRVGPGGAAALPDRLGTVYGKTGYTNVVSATGANGSFSFDGVSTFASPSFDFVAFGMVPSRLFYARTSTFNYLYAYPTSVSTNSMTIVVVENNMVSPAFPTPPATLSCSFLGYGYGGESSLGQNSLLKSRELNTALGYECLRDSGDSYVTGSSTIGVGNSCIGTLNSFANYSGINTVSMGYAGTYNSSTHNYNVSFTMMGPSFLPHGPYPNSGVMIGYNAGFGTVSNSAWTIGIGYKAFGKTPIATNAPESICIGALSGYNTASAPTANVLIGSYSGYNITTGGNNLIVGTQNLSSAITTGSGNTFVGAYTDNFITTGTNNTLIGYKAAANTLNTMTNSTALGYQASVGGSNQIVLGNSSIAVLRCQQTSITTLSDMRDKRDIKPLSLGLDFISIIRPVMFEWSPRKPGPTGKNVGFIAQELDEAQVSWNAEDKLRLVYKENPEFLEAAYQRLLPVVVRAIQELLVKVRKLQERVEKLEKI